MITEAITAAITAAIVALGMRTLRRPSKECSRLHCDPAFGCTYVCHKPLGHKDEHYYT